MFVPLVLEELLNTEHLVEFSISHRSTNEWLVFTLVEKQAVLVLIADKALMVHHPVVLLSQLHLIDVSAEHDGVEPIAVAFLLGFNLVSEVHLLALQLPVYLVSELHELLVTRTDPPDEILQVVRNAAIEHRSSSFVHQLDFLRLNIFGRALRTLLHY